MKAVLPWLLLLAGAFAPATSSRADEAIVPAPRPHLTTEMRNRAAEAASAAKVETTSPVPFADNAVELAPFKVNASVPVGPLRTSGPRWEPRPFTFTGGGTLGRSVGPHVTTDAGVRWDGGKGWSLLRFSF